MVSQSPILASLLTGGGVEGKSNKLLALLGIAVVGKVDTDTGISVGVDAAGAVHPGADNGDERASAVLHVHHGLVTVGAGGACRGWALGQHGQQ